MKMMTRYSRFGWIIFLIFFLTIGCSSGEDVFLPESVERIPVSFDASRISFGDWIISIDEDNGVEVIPLRYANHLNVIGFLEQWPCTNCLQVTGLDISPGQLDVTITMRHPFPGQPFFTGFDIRGICFLPGTFSLPGMMQTMPDFATEDYIEPIPGVYLGYTDLFNPVNSPDGLPFGYAQGKMTPWSKDLLTASLGAFQYFSSYPAGGVRNVFETYDVINLTYRIKRNVTGPIVFGYSVDASWEAPFETPVDVPDSFGPGANCLEAWKVEVEVDDASLFDDGGDLIVTAIAYDHQGSGTIQSAQIECPALTSGIIPGALIWEDVPNQCKAFEFTVPNIELTAASNEEVPFVVKVYPMEELILYAFNASTATVHPGGVQDCPPGVHDTFYGEGVFGQFGNYTIPTGDAAILTTGDYPGEFLMCGNGFAGSMLGGYEIDDLGPNEPHGVIGLIGVGGPASLDVSPVYGNIYIVMPGIGEEDDIQIYRDDGTQLQKIPAPNEGGISCLDVTPDEEIWFIERVGNAHYLHHAVAVAEWSWKIIEADSAMILDTLPSTTRVFDLVYEPKTHRIYVYHEYMNGSIAVYDASGTGPPTEMSELTMDAIWGYCGPLYYYDGGFYFNGADIELDLVDDEFTNCRIVVFANFELGGSSVMKLDADMNILDMAALQGGPYSTFAISIDPDLTKRRLVFLPMDEFNEDYYLFDPPVDW